jgi:ornithine cyclodeaminase
MKHDILFMNNTVVNNLVANNMNMVIEDIERCLSIFDNGDAINTGKLVTRWGDTPEDENIHGRINAMPGYLGGDYNVLGIKWIGSGPNNYNKGLPRASVTVILNDSDTKLPIAIADGTTVSAKRTGAVGGIAMKYLAKDNPKTIFICGAGAQGRTQLEAALTVCPTINKVFVYDISFERSEEYANEVKEKYNIESIPTNNIKEATKQSDIIVTVTLATEPFIEYEWLKKGVLILNMADYEVSYDCVSKADKIVCDTWEGIKHRMISTVAFMYKDGLIKDEDIYAEIGEIINKKKPGRENDDEIIYFNAVGMGIEDLAVVAHAYNLAKEQGLGQVVSYWE